MKLFNKNVEKALNKIGEESIHYVRQLLTEHNKIATGDLINSLDYETVKNINGLFLLITAKSYFQFVDRGRKVGLKPPPIKAILPWVKVKHVQFRNKDTGRFMSYKQTAFMVQRGIANNGIEPLHIKDKLIDNIDKNLNELIRTGAVLDIQEYINKIFFKAP